MKHDLDAGNRSFWLTLPGFCVLGLGGALLYFLLTEHTAHTLGALPWAIFLLCPIMHFFMHKGHGGHGGHVGHGGHGDPQPEELAAPKPNPSTHDHGGHGSHR